MRYWLCSLVLLASVSLVAGQDGFNRPHLVLDTGGHNAEIRHALFTPDGKTLLTVSLDKTVRQWDVKSGEMLRVLRPPINHNNQGELYAAALSPDGKTLAVAGFG